MSSTAAFTRAIVCPPADSYASGLTTSTLGAPDLTLARTQHAAYCDALREIGVAVTVLPADAAYPDSCFVEDTAIVTAKGVILCRPGARSRTGEVYSMHAALQRLLGHDVPAITEPGTVDGGDVCQAGNHFFIGLSARTNEAGADQLTRWLHGLGCTASTVSIRNDATLLHLKSGLTWLGGTQLLVVPSLAKHASFADYDLTATAAGEEYSANAVLINGVVLMAAGYPDTAARVTRLGHKVVALEMSEFRKMDGGLSCLSVRVP
ncbi:MAG TPA: arginine deiminase family protein [Gemmatimonadales bacterium]|nr:arginine deiminase family protein [Gemmatimonadales bacterium]